MLDVLGWFFLLCINFRIWFQVLVSFCNEKLKEINQSCFWMLGVCKSVYKWFLLMSPFMGSMWSRWVGLVSHVVLFFAHVLELLPAPQNCLAPREQGLTFKGFS